MALQDCAHAVERHVIRFRGETVATQADLNRVAAQLIVMAPQVPRLARTASKAAYVGIVHATRARIAGFDSPADDVGRSRNAVKIFLERQSFELGAELVMLESAIRRLSDETSRLSHASSAVQALDTNATLQRGFVLPLDKERRIIRSAKAARRRPF